jgi:hypothetical protein
MAFPGHLSSPLPCLALTSLISIPSETSRAPKIKSIFSSYPITEQSKPTGNRTQTKLQSKGESDASYFTFKDAIASIDDGNEDEDSADESRYWENMGRKGRSQCALTLISWLSAL